MELPLSDPKFYQKSDPLIIDIDINKENDE